MKEFTEELKAILAQYKEHEGDGLPCDHVIFFAEKEEDDVAHELCFETQLPAVIYFGEEKQPYMFIVKELGQTKYVSNS